MKTEFNHVNEFFYDCGKDLKNWKEYSREHSAREEDYKKLIKERTQFFYTIADCRNIITDYETQKQFPFWSVSELLTEIFAMNPPLMHKYKPEIVEWAYKLQPDKTVEYSYGRRWSEFRQILNII